MVLAYQICSPAGRLLPRCHGLAQDWGQEVEQPRLDRQKHHFQTWQSEILNFTKCFTGKPLITINNINNH